jgi:DNA polymerase-3 subunit beta
MTSLNVFDIEVKIKDLVSALSITTSLIERKSVNPILSCVQLKVEGNDLVIKATDGSIFVKYAIGVKIQNASMSIAVEGKLLERMLKGLNDENVRMVYLVDSNELLVSSISFELKLVVLDSQEFPKFPQLNSHISFEILGKDLFHLISNTDFSSSNEEIRYNLNGVCLHSAANKIFAASTDGFRLSTLYVENDQEHKDFKIILPSKTVNFLKYLNLPIFENHVVKAKISNNMIELSAFNILIISKLIDGAFPEYESLIPKNNTNKLVIKKSYFSNAIERVSGITDEKSKAIKISINKDNIEVSAYTQSKGEAKQSISNQFFQYYGEPLIIAFQPKYLIDVLGLIKNQEDFEIEIALKDSASPILITSEKLSNGKFVVMPIKIQN